LGMMFLLHHSAAFTHQDTQSISKEFERRNNGLEYAYPIVLGNNVWFGAGVQVMPGVTIGDNVVIGGGSVVVKDIPSNSVAVGNPCKVIREITEADKQKTWDR
jgi:maltose O-acetyltransferase